MVVKLTDKEAALASPRVVIEAAPRLGSGEPLVLRGNLVDMGDAKTLEAGFEYRAMVVGEDANVRPGPWVATPMRTVPATGEF